ncbi:hypothetical protein N1495_04600 [Streptococcus didelphis]|uniref:Uncharacterized protein n=1 Tax=Streptococcus didelphis TaxID=102886 RepID=A0ABY9LJ51_9STRE|nr:hypothetical protein [Streptococcus didelphis]WMB28185.1 hypothetical protein N1496_00185 [Streptococcus didelphis]WMB30096.1 hypothetical protein N1495_04600 [Streptococcus didelphis]
MGVSYRHLLEIFKEFRQEGLIIKNKKGTFTINSSKLEEYRIK